MRKPFWIMLGIILLAIIVIGAGLWGYLQIPSKSSAVLPLMVTFTQPDKGGSYPISGALQVRGEAIGGAPITKMELWADGQLMDTILPPIQNIYVFGHTWDWTPQTLGDHTLVLRAYDTSGQNTTSTALHITGVPDPGMLEVVTAFYGDTLDSLAAKYHTSVAEILAANRGLDPNAPLLGDIFIPVPPPTDLNDNSNQPDRLLITADQITSSQANGSSLVSWIQLEVIRPVKDLFAPSAPQLSATVSGCNVQLTIEDASSSENGFYIYRLDPQTSHFSKVGTLPAQSGSDAVQYTDQNLFGAYQYYVSSYDNSGESPSNITQVDVNQSSCPQSVDIFTPAQLINYAKLMDEVYLYLSVNQGDWKRIPQNEFEFLTPDTVINLSKTASLLATQPAQVLSVKGEMWGWKNGMLTFLGTFDKNVTPPSQPLSAPDFAMPPTTLYARKSDPSSASTGNLYLWVDQNKIPKLGTEIFKWATGADGVTGGQWQVSSVPFTDNLDPNPPGLLLTSQAPVPPNGGFVEFPIDLSSLSPSTVFSANSSNQPNQKGSVTPDLLTFPPFGPPFNQTQKSSNFLKALQSLLGLNPAGQVSSVSSSGMNSPLNLFTNNSPAGLKSTDQFIRYYVRVLPMKGEQAFGDPSNMVILDYYWQNDKIIISVTPPPVKPYELSITNVQPIHFPLSNYEHCIKIVKNPYYDDPVKFNADHPLQGPIYSLFKPGKMFCPHKRYGHDKTWLDVLKDGFKAILNKISSLYSKLTDFVVDIVALNPFCLQAEATAKAAGKDTTTIKDLCHGAAVIAVEAAKAYVGLPPSIPNYDQLQGLGEDYAAELAAQKLESSGIPCPEDCKNLIKQGIHDSYEQIKAGFSNTACMSDEQAQDNGYEHGICLPEDVISEPDPRGQYTDGIVTVQVKRKPGFNDADIPSFCNLGVEGSANNSFWVGKVLSLSGPFNTYGKTISWQGTSLAGLAFRNQKGVTIPKLTENQTISIPVLVSRIPQPYWISGHDTLWKGFTPALFDDDWAYLYHGAKLDVLAYSQCSAQPSNTYPVGPVTGPFEDLPVK
jgi:LysM repeat protein